jgi:hypothetical protein
MPLYLKKDGAQYCYLFALDDSKGGDGAIAHIREESMKAVAAHVD